MDRDCASERRQAEKSVNIVSQMAWYIIQRARCSDLSLPGTVPGTSVSGTVPGSV